MKELITALTNFQAEMPAIDLDCTVKVLTKSGITYNFKYATLGNIMKKSFPLLSKHGLGITQVFRPGELVTTLWHTSGYSIESVIPVDLHNGTMQEIGSRITYLKRYSYTALICVIGDEDEDANIASGNIIQKSESAKSKTEIKSPAKKSLPTQAHKDAWKMLLDIFEKDTERIKLAIDEITQKQSLFACSEEEAETIVARLTHLQKELIPELTTTHEEF